MSIKGRLDEIEDTLNSWVNNTSTDCDEADQYRMDMPFMLDLCRRQQAAIEEMKKALNNSFMAFADCASRVKAPEPYMLQDIKEALAKVSEILK